ncbi:hypothetical protein [Paenibacillus sp. GM2]|uniref:hypothetical protein n=1 Tax=Paenibacillus sp. GM2 TaxID=1622070 RepID=UPI000B2B06BB|nr:hypothetical protein [Paenibacillus sp. GM2]
MNKYIPGQTRSFPIRWIIASPLLDSERYRRVSIPLTGGDEIFDRNKNAADLTRYAAHLVSSFP